MTETHEQRIERLARALLADQGDAGKGKPVAPWERQPEAFRQRMLRNARAVIASDREAGYVTVPRELPLSVASQCGPVEITAEDVQQIWREAVAIAAHEQEEP